MADHVWRDPALTGVGDDTRFGDPRENPIAFLPVDGDALPSARSVLRAAPAQPWDPGGTYLMPTPAGRITYGGAVDYDNSVPAGDVADHNDPAADDPTPDEITDPDHPDYVEPWPA